MTLAHTTIRTATRSGVRARDCDLATVFTGSDTTTAAVGDGIGNSSPHPRPCPGVLAQVIAQQTLIGRLEYIDPRTVRPVTAK